MKNWKLEVGDLIKTPHVIWKVSSIDDYILSLTIVEQLTKTSGTLGDTGVFPLDEFTEAITTQRFELIKDKAEQSRKLYEKLNN